MSSLKFFVSAYMTKYLEGMSKIDLDSLNQAIISLNQAKGTIYVGGNGGSAAISNHLCCDFIKGARLKTYSISCNTPLITAISNDISYSDSLSYQIRAMKPTSDDICILISSSGNSPNIVKAAEACRELGVKVIGLTGFKGGELRKLADISLHIPVENYGVVEDSHQSIMHIISQYLAKGA